MEFYSKVNGILLKSAEGFTQKYRGFYSKVQRILLKSGEDFTRYKRRGQECFVLSITGRFETCPYR